MRLYRHIRIRLCNMHHDANANGYDFYDCKIINFKWKLLIHNSSNDGRLGRANQIAGFFDQSDSRSQVT